ncbi:hypothetical protein D3C73_942160 [compost metagenome]
MAGAASPPRWVIICASHSHSTTAAEIISGRLLKRSGYRRSMLPKLLSWTRLPRRNRQTYNAKSSTAVNPASARAGSNVAMSSRRISEQVKPPRKLRKVLSKAASRSSPLTSASNGVSPTFSMRTGKT